jgi:hypothetical protein
MKVRLKALSRACKTYRTLELTLFGNLNHHCAAFLQMIGAQPTPGRASFRGDVLRSRNRKAARCPSLKAWLSFPYQAGKLSMIRAMFPQEDVVFFSFQNCRDLL